MAITSAEEMTGERVVSRLGASGSQPAPAVPPGLDTAIQRANVRAPKTMVPSAAPRARADWVGHLAQRLRRVRQTASIFFSWHAQTERQKKRLSGRPEQTLRRPSVPDSGLAMSCLQVIARTQIRAMPSAPKRGEKREPPACLAIERRHRASKLPFSGGGIWLQSHRLGSGAGAGRITSGPRRHRHASDCRQPDACDGLPSSEHARRCLVLRLTTASRVAIRSSGVLHVPCRLPPLVRVLPQARRAGTARAQGGNRHDFADRAWLLLQNRRDQARLAPAPRMPACR